MLCIAMAWIRPQKSVRWSTPFLDRVDVWGGAFESSLWSISHMESHADATWNLIRSGVDFQRPVDNLSRKLPRNRVPSFKPLCLKV